MTNPTFRLVRQITIPRNHPYNDICRTRYEADINGAWVEKDYGNGSKSYKMVADCNPRAIEKMRAAA